MLLKSNQKQTGYQTVKQEEFHIDFRIKIIPPIPKKKNTFICPSELGRKKVDFPLPKIQFFINNDNFMGINFDDQTKQEN